MTASTPPGSPSVITLTNTPETATAAASLLRHVFADTYGAAIPADTLRSYLERAFAAETIAQELASPALAHLGVWAAGRLAGVCRMRAAACPVAVDGHSPFKIERFYVDRQFHGGGYAATLLAAALDAGRERGHDCAWLCAWERNHRALAFYRKHGFADVGAATVYVDDVAFNDRVLARQLL